jgi:hypothetical protein
VDDNPLMVSRVQVPEFDKQRATCFGEGRVTGTGWIFDISTSRVLTLFILKNTVKNQELFAQFMVVMTEAGMGRVANQAGCARNFFAITLEQFSIDTHDRRSAPRQTCGVDSDFMPIVGVQFHLLRWCWMLLLGLHLSMLMACTFFRRPTPDHTNKRLVH